MFLNGIKMYIIKQYTFDKLKKLNEKLKTDKITIKPSTVKNKKISIFINNNKIYDYIKWIMKILD